MTHPTEGGGRERTIIEETRAKARHALRYVVHDPDSLEDDTVDWTVIEFAAVVREARANLLRTEPGGEALDQVLGEVGIFPKAVRGAGDADYEERTPWMEGWNAAVKHITRCAVAINHGDAPPLAPSAPRPTTPVEPDREHEKKRLQAYDRALRTGGDMRHLTAAIALSLLLLASCTNGHPWEPKVVAIKCEEDPEVPGKLVCREIPVDSTSYGQP